MINSKGRFVIIQNRPTQFDVPLYSQMHREGVFDIFVFYTVVPAISKNAVDPEINVSPKWDHLHGLHYPNYFESSVFKLWYKIRKLAPSHVRGCLRTDSRLIIRNHSIHI